MTRANSALAEHHFLAMQPSFGQSLTQPLACVARPQAGCVRHNQRIRGQTEFSPHRLSTVTVWSDNEIAGFCEKLLECSHGTSSKSKNGLPTRIFMALINQWPTESPRQQPGSYQSVHIVSPKHNRFLSRR